MLLFVHQPELIKLLYSPNGSDFEVPQALESLRKMYEGLDIEQDPWFVHFGAIVHHFVVQIESRDNLREQKSFSSSSSSSSRSSLTAQVSYLEETMLTPKSA